MLGSHLVVWLYYTLVMMCDSTAAPLLDATKRTGPHCCFGQQATISTEPARHCGY